MKSPHLKICGILAAIIIFSFMFCSTTSLAWQGEDELDRYYQESDVEDAFGNIMEQAFVVIKKTNFAVPATGSPCDVAVEIAFEDEEETASVATASIVFSVDGGAFQSTPLLAPDAMATLWKGAIPAQKPGARVDFFPRFALNNGNVTTGAIESRPEYDMGVPDMDNSPDLVADDLDLIASGARYDDKHIYVKYTVAGNISGGTVTPASFNLYVAKFTNQDKMKGEGLLIGNALIYTPAIKEQGIRPRFIVKRLDESLAQYRDDFEEVFRSGIIFTDIQGMIDDGWQEGNGFLFDADASGTSSGNTFEGKIRRDSLGRNPSGHIRLITFTMTEHSDNFDHFLPVPMNSSNFLDLYFSSYSYTAL